MGWFSEGPRIGEPPEGYYRMRVTFRKRVKGGGTREGAVTVIARSAAEAVEEAKKFNAHRGAFGHRCVTVI